MPFFGAFGVAWNEAMVAPWSANPLGMLCPELGARITANVAVAQEPAGNLKPAKDKSIERIDGIVATIMATLPIQDLPCDCSFQGGDAGKSDKLWCGHTSFSGLP